MPNYRRSKIPGGTYFFTVVTHNRQPILTEPESRQILRHIWKDVTKKYPFETMAICLLPDHIHTIWIMPQGDFDYALRWRAIKGNFSREVRKINPEQMKKSESRIKRNESTIWQRRFWEHTIRDEKDLQHHLDYIHFNPVKHGYVEKTYKWHWSSFHRFVKLGMYSMDWREMVNQKLFAGNFGE